MALSFIRCLATNEWVVVEMQGSLSSHEHTSFQNLEMGKLLLRSDVRGVERFVLGCDLLVLSFRGMIFLVQGAPTLEIGNHLLEGKFENLKKPLLVCHKEEIDFAVRGVRLLSTVCVAGLPMSLPVY